MAVALRRASTRRFRLAWSSGWCRSASAETALIRRRKNGEWRTTARPSAAACSRAEREFSLARARSSTASAAVPSALRRADTAASRVPAISVSTAAATRPGRRSGLLGARVATSSATVQPIRASSQRLTPSPRLGARAVTKIDCTAAWVVIRGPAPTRVAIDMARAQTTATCHTPVPKSHTQRSPTATPTATPIATSIPRRSRAPKVSPRVITAATGAKTGCTWPGSCPAISHANAAVTAHWPIRNARRRQRSARLSADARPSRSVRPLRSKARSFTCSIEKAGDSMPPSCSPPVSSPTHPGRAR